MAFAGLLGRQYECALLDGILEDARAGRSRTLAVRGAAGIGKSALLDHMIRSAPDFTVLRAAGVEPEMELPFAGLQQLCAPVLDGIASLPEPQRDALETVFGLRSGNPPQPILVGLAALGLVSDAAGHRPVLCVVDDVQWLDRASAQALAFVARRLMADALAMVFAVREPSQDLAGIPELVLRGLRDADARALLASVPGIPLDEQVRERIVAESSGNPLALLEWHGASTSADLDAGPFPSAPMAAASQLEQLFRARLAELPTATRRFLLVAAAEPVGDALLVWRAAQRLGVRDQDTLPAVEAGLVTLGPSIRFQHPLVRSAAYESAAADERRSAHQALADLTDPLLDPDRRAWHRARATLVPDEAVAGELERSADRAEARGGLVAAAAFLESSTALTVDRARKAHRALRAAVAHHQAGAPDVALRLLDTAEAGPLDEFGRARADLLRAQIAHTQNRRSDAPQLLLQAARRLEPLDVASARDAYVNALWAAQFAGRLAREGQLLEVAHAALAAPQLPQPRAVDLLLDGSATSLVHGYAAGVPLLRDAVRRFCGDDVSREDAIRWSTFAGVAAQFLWDLDSAETLSTRHIVLGRESGAVAILSAALGLRIVVLAVSGELHAASQLVDEAQTFADAIDSTLQPYGPLIVAAWRGREGDVAGLVDATLSEAAARGEDEAVAAAHHALAVLYNGSSHFDAAVTAAASAVPPLADGQTISNFALVELVEACARSGQVDQGTQALQSLQELTQASGTEWALGVEARSRALLAPPDEAEDLHQLALERLGRTRLRGELARAHLVYGEWLRRTQRRADARRQLRTAYEMFIAMGADHFAERCRRELVATGETVRARRPDALVELTPQEAQIARFARDGRTNTEIGAELFISARTVEYHLSHVYAKLGVSSRTHLQRVMPEPSR